MPNLSTAQIGRCGELLVQFELLKRGIESAPLTTDKGLDLVAYATGLEKPVTIQVKTNLKPKPGGGKGKLALDWWIPKSSPADLVALAELETKRVWIFTIQELCDLAQQQPEDSLHMIMAVDPTTSTRRDGKAVHDHAFAMHLIENCVHRHFFEADRRRSGGSSTAEAKASKLP